MSSRVRELLSATSQLYMHAERQEVANAAETDSALETVQAKYKVRLGLTLSQGATNHTSRYWVRLLSSLSLSGG